MTAPHSPHDSRTTGSSLPPKDLPLGDLPPKPHGNLELNKIFAALLVAGITAMLAGFFAHQLVHPHVPEKAVLDIDTSALEAAATGGPAGPVGPEPILALLEKADVKRGEQLSKACTACHSFNKDGKDGVGPNQWNLVMSAKAHKDGFAYSDALKSLHAKGEKWTYADLNNFIYKPQVAVPGTKMNYLGLKKTEDRAALIAYLRTLSDSPAALPSNEEIQAEQAAYDGAQPKAAAPAADPAQQAGAAGKAPASGNSTATAPPPAAPTQSGTQNDAIGDKPASDTSGAKPLENSVRGNAGVKTGETMATDGETPNGAVPPPATP